MHNGDKTRLLHRMEDSGKRAWKRWGAVEDYLERCADIKVDIEALERLIEPEDEEVCLKIHPEVLDERRQQYFPAL